NKTNCPTQAISSDADRTTDSQVTIAIILEPGQDDAAPATAIEFTLHERFDDISAFLDKVRIDSVRQTRRLPDPHHGMCPGMVAKDFDPIADPVFALNQDNVPRTKDPLDALHVVTTKKAVARSALVKFSDHIRADIILCSLCNPIEEAHAKIFSGNSSWRSSVDDCDRL